MADSYATRNLSARFADHFRTLKLHEQQMIKSLFNPDGHTTPSFTMTVGVHNPRTISIPTHLVSTLSTSTVRSYLSYLAISSHFASTADPTESRHPLEGTCTWAQCKHLLESHIFGTIIGDADYQAYILSEMTKWLKPAQKPDLQVLEAVVLNNEASMELKDWVIKRMYEEDVVAQASFRAMVLTAAHRKRDEVRNGVRNSVHSSEGERRKSGEGKQKLSFSRLVPHPKRMLRQDRHTAEAQNEVARLERVRERRVTTQRPESTGVSRKTDKADAKLAQQAQGPEAESVKSFSMRSLFEPVLAAMLAGAAPSALEYELAMQKRSAMRAAAAAAGNGPTAATKVSSDRRSDVVPRAAGTHHAEPECATRTTAESQEGPVPRCL